MTANPFDLVGGMASTANVPKGDLTAWVKARVAQLLASATELRNTLLLGQLAVGLKSTGQTYYLDAADTTTADDGLTCIVSLDGGRFKLVGSFVLDTDGTLAANSDSRVATQKAVRTFFDGAVKNDRLAKTSAYTLTSSDNAKTIALGGSACYALTVSAASGYDAKHTNIILNEDAGRAKRIKINGLAAFWLWPLQSVILFNQNNVWQVHGQARWKVPNNTTVFVDLTNGSDTGDTNDGLASGSGNAVKTLGEAVRVRVKDYFDLSGQTSYPTACVTIQLADNLSGGVPYSLGHFAFNPVGGEGRCAILITGNASTPSNVVISDSGGTGISAFGGGMQLQLANLQVGWTNPATTPIANSGISAADGALVTLQGTVIVGKCTAQQLFAQNGGKIVLLGTLTPVAGAVNLAFADDGTIDLSSHSVTFSNSPNYSGQTVAAINGGKILAASTTWSGTVTGTRYFASGLSLIDTATGTPNSVIPGNANGSTATGAVVN